MITSNRRFGVEIEFQSPSEEALRKISRELRIVFDGSLRGVNYAGEYVSEPLKGKIGERVIRKACDILNKHKASGENPKTSIHVHLDGRVGEGVLHSSRTDIKQKGQIAISNRLKKELGPTNILKVVNRTYFNPLGDVNWSEYSFEGTKFLSKAKLTRKPRLNYTYYWLEKDDRLEWVRNMFYFYTNFSDVMESLVSPSRQFGNMYCIPLGSSFSLDEIARADTMEELKRIWYKDAPPGGDYCNSRYRDVNFHCFWYKHGTVEIRSHGGTTNANKILLWLTLHQKIADKLEKISTEELRLIGSTEREFLKFIEEPLLQDYVKRLIGFYKIKE